LSGRHLASLFYTVFGIALKIRCYSIVDKKLVRDRRFLVNRIPGLVIAVIVRYCPFRLWKGYGETVIIHNIFVVLILSQWNTVFK
jgi:hypothetical protein